MTNESARDWGEEGSSGGSVQGISPDSIFRDCYPIKPKGLNRRMKGRREMNSLVRMLQEMSLMANESLADRTIQRERLKAARARVTLYDDESRHMCLKTGCREPVAGKQIFAHCERHLKQWEQGWFKENAESVGVSRVSQDEATHPVVRVAQQSIESRKQELIKQNVESKFNALADARALLETNRSLEEERRAFLPPRLLKRIDDAYRSLLGSARGSLVEDE
jgi:hypothetical protein